VVEQFGYGETQKGKDHLVYLDISGRIIIQDHKNRAYHSLPAVLVHTHAH
jgi:hypothetical protein